MKIAFALAVLTLAAPVAAQDRAKDAAELERISQTLIDSIAPGDPGPFDEYLDPALVHVDENDVVRDKAAFLKEIRPLPKGIIGTSKVEDFRATFAGDLAFTTYVDQEHVDIHGQAIHTRFRISDTWRRTPRGWRIIGEHIGAILKDPPALALPGETLCSYAGSYQLCPDTVARIRCEGDHLMSERPGRPPATYKAEVKDMFFAPGSPRSRRVFLRDAAGAITGFADRREGEDVVWKRVG
jgi:hypothetical protein